MSGIYSTPFRFLAVSSPSTSTHRLTKIRASAAIASPPVTTRTPYEVLHVKETATAVEIKTAYRSLAKRFHPDAAVGNGQDVFIEIHNAYTTLSDPVARARYDASTNHRRATFSHHASPAATYGMRTSRWETDQCW